MNKCGHGVDHSRHCLVCCKVFCCRQCDKVVDNTIARLNGTRVVDLKRKINNVRIDIKRYKRKLWYHHQRNAEEILGSLKSELRKYE